MKERNIGETCDFGLDFETSDGFAHGECGLGIEAESFSDHRRLAGR